MKTTTEMLFQLTLNKILSVHRVLGIFRILYNSHLDAWSRKHLISSACWHSTLLFDRLIRIHIACCKCQLNHFNIFSGNTLLKQGEENPNAVFPTVYSNVGLNWTVVRFWINLSAGHATAKIPYKSRRFCSQNLSKD